MTQDRRIFSIVGAGPAGMAAAVAAQALGLDVLRGRRPAGARRPDLARRRDASRRRRAARAGRGLSSRRRGRRRLPRHAAPSTSRAASSGRSSRAFAPFCSRERRARHRRGAGRGARHRRAGTAGAVSRLDAARRADGRCRADPAEERRRRCRTGRCGSPAAGRCRCSTLTQLLACWAARSPASSTRHRRATCRAALAASAASAAGAGRSAEGARLDARRCRTGGVPVIRHVVEHRSRWARSGSRAVRYRTSDGREGDGPADDAAGPRGRRAEHPCRRWRLAARVTGATIRIARRLALDRWGETSLAGSVRRRRRGRHRRRRGRRACVASSRRSRIAGDSAGSTRAQADRRAGGLRRRLGRELALRPFLDALFRRDRQSLRRMTRRSSAAARRSPRATSAPRGRDSRDPTRSRRSPAPAWGPARAGSAATPCAHLWRPRRSARSAEVGFYRIRPPLKPVTLGELACARRAGAGGVSAHRVRRRRHRRRPARPVGGAASGARAGARSSCSSAPGPAATRPAPPPPACARCGRDLAEMPISLEAMDMWHRIAAIVGDDCGFHAHGQICVAETPRAPGGAERARGAMARSSARRTRRSSIARSCAGSCRR